MNKYRSQSYFNVFTGLMAALVISSVLGSTTACSGDNNAASSDGWVDLFNGKDLTGWKIAPNSRKKAGRLRDTNRRSM